jgi:hypothetical protein
MTVIDWDRLPCPSQKVFYISRTDALADRHHIRVTARHLTPRRLRPYQCRHCGGWHLTSH